MKATSILFLLLSLASLCVAQTPQTDRQQFIRVETPVIALRHTRVIDGTGAAPLEDQTIIIGDGKIKGISPTRTDEIPPTNTRTIDLTGLVAMHDHMFFPMGAEAPEVLEHAEIGLTPLRDWRQALAKYVDCQPQTPSP